MGEAHWSHDGSDNPLDVCLADIVGECGNAAADHLFSSEERHEIRVPRHFWVGGKSTSDRGDCRCESRIVVLVRSRGFDSVQVVLDPTHSDVPLGVCAPYRLVHR